MKTKIREMKLKTINGENYMPKYHDQEYIKTVCRKIQNETDENIKAITKQLNELKDVAQHDVDKISIYTAPEEVKRRQQSLYYYQDVLEELAKHELGKELEKR